MQVKIGEKVIFTSKSIYIYTYTSRRYQDLDLGNDKRSEEKVQEE